MSLILDALKKLDREKSFRRNKTPNIAVEILRPDQPRRGKRMQMYFVLAGLTAFATAAITYAVIAQFGLRSKLSLPATANPPAASQRVVHAPLSDEPVPDVRDEISSMPPKIQGRAESKKLAPSGSPLPASVAAKPPGQQVGAASRSVEPVPDVRDEISQVPSKIQGRAESKKPAITDSAPSASVIEKPPGQQVVPAPLSSEAVPHVRDEISQVPLKIQDQAKSKKTAASPPSEPSATPPSLTLTGILWHEDPSERRAVVNGTVLTEGSVIEGVKVLEIYPTYVRFSHNGRAFEISMNFLER